MTTSNAEVNQYLLDYATKSHKILGEDVTLPNSEIVKVERFLSQNTITDDEALNVIERVSIPTTYPEETMTEVINFFKNYELKSIGIGSFGPIDINKESKTYLQNHHLHAVL